ncbi:MAG: SIS domain-containing protein [Bifidobacteriaceae bacterium]|jgi:uncharacterized phosphosugar-binding protein|nr:SIS domain-containing protein [Bifidobacteriaceae bacterium]
MASVFADYSDQVSSRLRGLDELAATGGLDKAIAIFADSLRTGGVIQAFGTGHSQAFAMEIAGRAGGFIPTNAVRLVDLVLLGSRPKSALGTAEFERDFTVGDELYELYEIHPEDAFIIASNSGANGSTVGLALRAKREGHPVIAVTSLEHSRGVESKHPSGQRLFEVADVVIDNLAPYGDATLAPLDGVAMGAVSSITAAYIAQLLTIGAAACLQSEGHLPPLYISANIPGGDEHNNELEERFGPRIKPFRYLPEGA